MVLYNSFSAVTVSGRKQRVIDIIKIEAAVVNAALNYIPSKVNKDG